MEIFYLYSPELYSNATFRIVAHDGKKRKIRNANIFRTEEDAKLFLPFAEKILGNGTVTIKKCQLKEYLKEYADHQYYPQWLKEALIDDFQQSRKTDPDTSIRKFAKKQGIKYYTFRDWYRDYKEEE